MDKGCMTRNPTTDGTVSTYNALMISSWAAAIWSAVSGWASVWLGAAVAAGASFAAGVSEEVCSGSAG